MPRIKYPTKKSSIIGDWLDGETRENIAIKHNIGSGTGYNIVQRWSNSIGIEKTYLQSELYTKLKKNGLTSSDCAKRFRRVMNFLKYGIKKMKQQTELLIFKGDLFEMSRG